MTCPDPHEADAVAAPPGVTHSREVWAALLRRVASPSYLLFALVMFPLPWVKIQCAREEVPLDSLSWAHRADSREIVHCLWPPADAHTLVSQSGLQAALGTCSVPGQGEDSAKAEEAYASHMSPSPLMAAWAALVLGGWLAGYLLPLGRRRHWAVGGCAATALLVLGAQVLFEFPIVALMERDAAERPPPEQPPARAQDDKRNWQQSVTREGKVYRVEHFSCVAYTPWFYLAALSTGWALVLTGLGWRRDRRRRSAEGLPAPQSCEPDTRIRSP